MHNFYAQLYGVKRFLLFAPKYWDSLYLYPFLHPGAQSSQVRFAEEIDLSRFPKFAEVRALEAILFPGDVLYVPPLWGHHVTTLSTSISVSVWSKAPETTAMHQAARKSLPFLSSWSANKIALAARVFLRELIHKVYPGPSSAKRFVRELIENRYRPLLDSVPTLLSPNPMFCSQKLHAASESSSTSLKDLRKSMAEAFQPDVEAFAKLFASHNEDFERDVWLGNTCEQLAITAAGAQHSLRFLVDFVECK
jgi:hypothetical protein